MSTAEDTDTKALEALRRAPADTGVRACRTCLSVGALGSFVCLLGESCKLIVDWRIWVITRDPHVLEHVSVGMNDNIILN